MYESWETLKNECTKCTKCDLCKERTNVVFGEGNPKAEVMLIGEGPGEQEDLQGKPFVGRSGKLLDKMLEEIGLSRNKNIYIGNIVKCRPSARRARTLYKLAKKSGFTLKAKNNSGSRKNCRNENN